MIIFLSVLFGLLSMVFYALANAYSKNLSQQLGAPLTIFLRCFTIVVILGFATALNYSGYVSWQYVIIAVILGILGYLPLLAFTHGIKNSPIGIMAPIAGTAPLVTVILSTLFLSVVLTPFQWFAILLVLIANVAISVDLKSWQNFKFIQTSNGIPLALAAAIGWGMFFFFLVPVTDKLGPWLSAFLVELGVAIAAGIHLKITSQKINYRKAFSWPVISNGIFIAIGTLAFTIGISYYNVGIVVTLGQSSALITILLGVWIYKEHLTLKERVLSLIMIIGVALLTFSGS